MLWYVTKSVVGTNVSKGHATYFFMVDYIAGEGSTYVHTLPSTNKLHSVTSHKTLPSSLLLDFRQLKG